MLKNILLLASLTLLNLVLETTPTHAVSDRSQKSSPDFFVTTVESDMDITAPLQHESQNLSDCRASIQQKICLVDPLPEGKDPTKPRACLNGGIAYAHFFESLYDHFPQPLQKLMCSLQIIRIEKQLIGTAYAGVLQDSNKNIVGTHMGIRKSVLDESLTLTTWASWKEQLSFGGDPNSYTLSGELPVIETKTDSSDINDFLFFVIAHELGHVMDFTQKINRTQNCDNSDEDQECAMADGSWGAIGWITDRRPKPANDFLHRSALCFYWCGDHFIDPDKVTQVYDDLHATDFISLYATSNPWDDFADSLAYWLMDQQLQTRYVIDTRRGMTLDVIKRLHSAPWEAKRAYLHQVLHSDDAPSP